jgi:transposase InsO family protein
MRPRLPSIPAELKGADSRPRRVRERRARGFPASQARVERLMRAQSIRGRHQRRDTVATDARHALPVAANVLNRAFNPSAPHPVWSADITALWTDEGQLDLVSVLDRFHREVVRWSLQPRLTADSVTDALTMAGFRRQPAPGLMHHSDRGRQSASHLFQDKPSEDAMVCSMRRQGNGWDHAPTESGFNRFAHARIFGERFATRAAMTTMAFASIAGFDNRKRLYATLGDTSPVQFLKNWISTQQAEKQVA